MAASEAMAMAAEVKGSRSRDLRDAAAVGTTRQAREPPPEVLGWRRSGSKGNHPKGRREGKAPPQFWLVRDAAAVYRRGGRGRRVRAAAQLKGRWRRPPQAGRYPERSAHRRGRAMLGRETCHIREGDMPY
eukprot:2968575-Prymnesium_polylepis.2